MSKQMLALIHLFICLSVPLAVRAQVLPTQKNKIVTYEVKIRVPYVIHLEFSPPKGFKFVPSTSKTKLGSAGLEKDVSDNGEDKYAVYIIINESFSGVFNVICSGKLTRIGKTPGKKDGSEDLWWMAKITAKPYLVVSPRHAVVTWTHNTRGGPVSAVFRAQTNKPEQVKWRGPSEGFTYEPKDMTGAKLKVTVDDDSGLVGKHNFGAEIRTGKEKVLANATLHVVDVDLRLAGGKESSSEKERDDEERPGVALTTGILYPVEMTCTTTEATEKAGTLELVAIPKKRSQDAGVEFYTKLKAGVFLPYNESLEWSRDKLPDDLYLKARTTDLKALELRYHSSSGKDFTDRVTTTVEGIEVHIEKIPDYLFAYATYATPITFSVRSKRDVRLSSVKVVFFADGGVGSASDKKRFEVDLTDRTVVLEKKGYRILRKGKKVTPGRSFECYVPSAQFRRFTMERASVSRNARFQVVATMQIGRRMLTASSPQSEGRIAERFCDKRVFAVDMVDKTLAGGPGDSSDVVVPYSQHPAAFISVVPFCRWQMLGEGNPLDWWKYPRFDLPSQGPYHYWCYDDEDYVAFLKKFSPPSSPHWDHPKVPMWAKYTPEFTTGKKPRVPHQPWYPLDPGTLFEGSDFDYQTEFKPTSNGGLRVYQSVYMKQSGNNKRKGLYSGQSGGMRIGGYMYYSYGPMTIQTEAGAVKAMDLRKKFASGEVTTLQGTAIAGLSSKGSPITETEYGRIASIGWALAGEVPIGPFKTLQKMLKYALSIYKQLTWPDYADRSGTGVAKILGVSELSGPGTALAPTASLLAGTDESKRVNVNTRQTIGKKFVRREVGTQVSAVLEFKTWTALEAADQVIGANNRSVKAMAIFRLTREKKHCLVYRCRYDGPRVDNPKMLGK